MPPSTKKILIIGPSWVGDMVMAQSLFITLKQQHPDCQIDVLAPSWSLPILQRMPEINQGIAMPIGHGSLQLGMRYQLGKSLRAKRYDQSIILPNSLKSALVPLFAQIPQRTGWRGEMRYGLLNDIRLLSKTKYPLMVQRFIALAYQPGAELPEQPPRPSLQINTDALNKLQQRHRLNHQQPILALCPGAEFGPAKRWPEKHYAELANTFIERGWQLAIFGSAKDKPVATTIINSLPAPQQKQCVNLAGTTTLAEAVDLLSSAAAVVSNDSGLMHIAAALGQPMAVVYGSTSPKFTPPLSDNVAIEQLGVDCGPCFQRECPLSQNKLKCLRELSPAVVTRSLEKLLAVPS